MHKLGTEGRRAEQVIVHLKSLSGVTDGGSVSELEHALQFATRAERAGADEDVVLAALLHDIGKVFGDAEHGPIAAALLTPHVRDEVVQVVRHHGAFTSRHWRSADDGRPDPRDAFANEQWFALACRFVDEWDMQSFDPDYDTLSLEHFEPLIRRRITGP